MEHINESAEAMWQAYVREAGLDGTPTYTAWHFCDNEADADELAELVKAGRKRATASAVWSYEHEHEPLPQVGAFSVILDWHGEARCIIRTTHVDITPFEEVSETFARTEGEGDGSLAYWREGHWRYFTRELEAIGRQPDLRMPVVCERFEVVHGGAS